MAEEGQNGQGAGGAADGGAGDGGQQAGQQGAGGQGAGGGGQQAGGTALTGGEGTGQGAGESWLDQLPENVREAFKGYDSLDKVVEALRPPAVPEGEYVVPEGLEVDAELMKQFTPLAKELGLTQESMDKLLKFDVERMNKLPEQIMAMHQAQLKEQQVNMAAEMGKDKYDGMVADAHRAMRVFADPEVTKWMNETGQGDNPVLLRFMAKIGAAIKEDTPPGGQGGGGGGEKSTAEIMYPDMKK